MVGRMLKRIIVWYVENQIKLGDGGNNINENKETDNNFNDEPYFRGNIQIYDAYSSLNLVTGLATVISPKTHQTFLLPSDIRAISKWPTKSKQNDKTQSSISLQNMFLKEAETMRTFTELL